MKQPRASRVFFIFICTLVLGASIARLAPSHPVLAVILLVVGWMIFWLVTASLVHFGRINK